MSALLVTGAAGFIGTNFVHHWRRGHPDDLIVALDALTYAGVRANLAGLEGGPGFEFVHGDIRDQTLVEQLLRGRGIDTIVHFAAESHVDRSITGPDAFIETNIVGTHALLKAAGAVWLDPDSPREGCLFQHISTDEVYGSLGPDDPPFREDTPFAPNSPYAASKAAADHLARAHHRTFGLPVVTSNCSNNYGPYQFPEKLIPLFLTNILRGNPLPVYGDGRQIRDWLHVGDHCRAIELCIRKGRSGETYNIGGGSECANIDLIHALCATVDQRFAGDPALATRFPQAPPASGGKSASLITHVADRPGHDTRYAIDASKIKRELGYRPQTSFATGLAHTVDWYLDRTTSGPATDTAPDTP